jgi:hypothetical protein
MQTRSRAGPSRSNSTRGPSIPTQPCKAKQHQPAAPPRALIQQARQLLSAAPARCQAAKGLTGPRSQPASHACSQASRDNPGPHPAAAPRCPPCRQFTPRMADTYSKLAKDGVEWEVVYVSCDRNKHQFEASQAVVFPRCQAARRRCRQICCLGRALVLGPRETCDRACPHPKLKNCRHTAWTKTQTALQGAALRYTPCGLMHLIHSLRPAYLPTNITP